MTLPEPFGWRTSWIAVKMAEARLMCADLRLTRTRSCDWEVGLREASQDGIFLTPSIEGWTLVVGLSLPDAAADETLPLIVSLSERYGSTQYFGNHRVVDYYAWARAERGRLKRAFAYLGEQGVVLWDRGELTVEEAELGQNFFEPVSAENLANHSVMEPLTGLKKNQRFPTEHDVFRIAYKWSIDPTQIQEYEISGDSGILGYFEISRLAKSIS